MINSIYRPNKSKINRNSKSMMQNVESAENFIKNESLGKEDGFRSETIDVSLPQLKKDSSQMMLFFARGDSKRVGQISCNSYWEFRRTKSLLNIFVIPSGVRRPKQFNRLCGDFEWPKLFLSLCVEILGHPLVQEFDPVILVMNSSEVSADHFGWLFWLTILVRAFNHFFGKLCC